FGIISIFLPRKGLNLAGVVSPLPDEIPALDDWEWIHLPGHAPGQIGLFRPSDHTLIAGDALATVNTDSLADLLKKRQQISRAGAPFNCDWRATVESVRHLAQLEPEVIAAGHGTPMSGPETPAHLRAFAEEFAPPRRGRYVAEAAKTDNQGIL